MSLMGMFLTYIFGFNQGYNKAIDNMKKVKINKI